MEQTKRPPLLTRRTHCTYAHPLCALPLRFSKELSRQWYSALIKLVAARLSGCAPDRPFLPGTYRQRRNSNRGVPHGTHRANRAVAMAKPGAALCRSPCQNAKPPDETGRKWPLPTSPPHPLRRRWGFGRRLRPFFFAASGSCGQAWADLGCHVGERPGPIWAAMRPAGAFKNTSGAL